MKSSHEEDSSRRDEESYSEYQSRMDNLLPGDYGYAEHNAEDMDQDEYIAAKYAEGFDSEDYGNEVEPSGHQEDYGEDYGGDCL